MFLDNEIRSKRTALLLQINTLQGCVLHTVHEMARDEARHGKAFAGLLARYFG
jgi:hypothetical protein